jgi:hypothetical protein
VEHTLPLESTLRVTDAWQCSSAGSFWLGWTNAAQETGALFLDRMTACVGGDEHTTVLEMHQTAIADHRYVLSCEPHPRFE